MVPPVAACGGDTGPGTGMVTVWPLGSCMLLYSRTCGLPNPIGCGGCACWGWPTWLIRFSWSGSWPAMVAWNSWTVLASFLNLSAFCSIPAQSQVMGLELCALLATAGGRWICGIG